MKKIFSLLTFFFLNGAVMPLIGAIQYDIREERDRIQQERDRRRKIKLEEEMKNYIAMINNVNLGVIRHNNKQSIFENLPKKYPRYANFTLKIEIPINNYDYSNEHYWAFVRFKSFTTRQNEDALTAKVIFNTEDNLSQKIKTILENQEIQNWVNDFRQFSDNVKFLIDTVIPKLDYNAEILWVFNTIETLKTYLREFTNIINIIKIQLQLKKIYYWKSDIEQEINQLKQQIKKYQDNLDLIRNRSHSNNNFNVLTDCSNYGFLTASVLGISAGFSLLFPPLAATIAFLSAISAGITSTIASTCSILE